MKNCRRCQNEKPLSEFYPHSQMGDGHLNICKECIKTSSQKYYLKKNKERNWRLKERKRTRERNKRLGYHEKYKERNKLRLREAQQVWVQKNPDAKKAHCAVNNAIRDGRLKREKCFVCGKEKAEAHHDDYSKPLEVRWLCKKHHAELHWKLD